MFFVTVNRKPYVLFAKTPSERAAIGLTEAQMVQLLRYRDETGEWEVMAEWQADMFSHTDFMVAMHHRDEPADPADLLKVLPDRVRPRQPT